MDTTRPSLLLRIRNREDRAAWEAFDSIYRPMLSRFARARGLDDADAEDVVQQCMSAIHGHIDGFDYDPDKGRFKGWLRTLVNNRIRNLARDRREGRADTKTLENVPDAGDLPEDVFERLWMQEHLWHCLRQVREDVEETTFRAYELYVIEQRPIDAVCRELNLTANHVYTIKWRLTEKVSARMKELLEGAD